MGNVLWSHLVAFVGNYKPFGQGVKTLFHNSRIPQIQKSSQLLHCDLLGAAGCGSMKRSHVGVPVEAEDGVFLLVLGQDGLRGGLEALWICRETTK